MEIHGHNEKFNFLHELAISYQKTSGRLDIHTYRQTQGDTTCIYALYG